MYLDLSLYIYHEQVTEEFVLGKYLNEWMPYGYVSLSIFGSLDKRIILQYYGSHGGSLFCTGIKFSRFPSNRVRRTSFKFIPQQWSLTHRFAVGSPTRFLCKKASLRGLRKYPGGIFGDLASSDFGVRTFQCDSQ